MGGIFSGNVTVEHACQCIIPSEDAKRLPDEDPSQKYQEKWTDIAFSVEHHCTYDAFVLAMMRGFGYDSVKGFEPELYYRHPKKSKDRVVTRHTRLADYIVQPNIVFVCYLFKKSTQKHDRQTMVGLVRKNSQTDIAGLTRTPSSERAAAAAAPAPTKSKGRKNSSSSLL